MSSMMITLQGENRQLTAEVQRLTKELEERDKLITSLEFQIQALLNEKATTPVVGPARPDSGTTFRPPPADFGDNGKLGKSQRRLSESLMPPSRSTVEMEHPLAPEINPEEEKEEVAEVEPESEEKEPTPADNQESEPPAQTEAKEAEPGNAGTNNNMVVEGEKKDEKKTDNRPVLKPGLKSNRGAIKTLPREISIANDDDDEVTKFSIEDGNATAEVDKAEMRDAYNAKGVYTGSMAKKERLPHGKGTMEYHTAGRIYEGDWHMGHWHGKGTIRTDKGVFVGEVVNDLKEGMGEMFYADGHQFKGTFKEDEPVEGTLSYPDKREYTGELHNGIWHGQGTLKYPDGSWYIGDFHSGVQHGKGTYHFSDGSVYEGDSVMGAYEGKGKMTWSDGGWYEGEWKAGEANGYGMEIRKDGSLRHHGQWRKGVPVRK